MDYLITLLEDRNFIMLLTKLTVLHLSLVYC